MTSAAKPYYSPALRMKAGELIGLRELAPDIADRVMPRLILPPPADRSDELQASLFAGDAYPDMSVSLASHWAGRPVLVEASYLLEEYGRDRVGSWLPRMFERARDSGARPIPLLALRDLNEKDLAAFGAAVDGSEGLKIGFVMLSGSLADREAAERVLRLLDRLGISPAESAIIADFSDADFSDPAIVAPIISGVLDTLHQVAPWRQIVFQGSNFPERNPADPGKSCLVPRNEWLAWREAVALDPDTADYIVFGDYAADCTKLNYRGGGIPIRHYRYAVEDAWLVQRGADHGTQSAAMRNVGEAIVTSGQFAGRGFSVADNRIYEISKGICGAGGAREWRAANTGHHITRAVVDIGRLRGGRFARTEIASGGEQLSLLPEQS